MNHQREAVWSVFSVRGKQKNRLGAAAVEFALTAPLFFLFIFAGMEFSRANMLRNLCDNAALEAARAGVIPGATGQKCIDTANEALSILSVQNATVTVEPSVIDPTTPVITVTVSVPLGDNAMPMSQFVIGTTLTRTITLRRSTIGAGGGESGSSSLPAGGNDDD